MKPGKSSVSCCCARQESIMKDFNFTQCQCDFRWDCCKVLILTYLLQLAKIDVFVAV